MRSSSKDSTVVLRPPKKLSLDQCIEFLLATDQISKDASGFRSLVEQPTSASDYL